MYGQVRSGSWYRELGWAYRRLKMPRLAVDDDLGPTSSHSIEGRPVRLT